MGTQVSAGCRSIYIPSGNLLHSYWKWPIEIVDLPIKNGDVPQFFVCLPGRVVQSPKKSLCSLADLPSNVRKSIRRHSWQPAHEFLRRETLLWWIVQLRPRWLQNGSANGDVHTNPNIVKHRQSESIRINQNQSDSQNCEAWCGLHPKASYGFDSWNSWRMPKVIKARCQNWQDRHR